jgi:hypothetical protein
VVDTEVVAVRIHLTIVADQNPENVKVLIRKKKKRGMRKWKK